MKHWKHYEPDASRPWNLQRAWTLHRRAGFAATWNELQRDLADGPQKSIDRVLSATSRIDGIPDNYAEMSRIIGESAVASGRPERMAAWWIYLMYFSPDPLRERMAILWHNHFATSMAKVNSLPMMREQNNIFRTHGLGPFEELLSATLKHGAMLKWLDGDENRAGKANENLGRETLELFTLGIGNYSEDDVKNASRALTGWSVHQSKFRVRDEWHDTDEKTILGNTGDFTGDDLINIVVNHPATSKRLAWRLCSEYLSEKVATQDRIFELANWLAANDLDLQGAMQIVLNSDAFYSDDNIKRRVVDPESFIVGAIRALELFDPPASTMVLCDWNEQLGRKLFYPPNVGGWPGDRAWLNSRTAIARANFGAALVSGKLSRSGTSKNLIAFAAQHTGNSKPVELVGFYCELLTGSQQEQRSNELIARASHGSDDQGEMMKNVVALILASPEAQLG